MKPVSNFSRAGVRSKYNDLTRYRRCKSFTLWLLSYIHNTVRVVVKNQCWRDLPV